MSENKNDAAADEKLRALAKDIIALMQRIIDSPDPEKALEQESAAATSTSTVPLHTHKMTLSQFDTLLSTLRLNFAAAPMYLTCGKNMMETFQRIAASNKHMSLAEIFPGLHVHFSSSMADDQAILEERGKKTLIVGIKPRS